MKARQPDAAGRAERDGVGLSWQVYGAGDVTIALLPTWSILPADFWKLQVPTRARRHRVLTFHGRGNPRSGCPAGGAAYTHLEVAADIQPVFDATGTEAAVLVGLSRGVPPAVQFAADHPERARGLIAIGPAVPLAPASAHRRSHSFEDAIADPVDWEMYNAPFWLRHYEQFVEFFAARMFNEPHSTKQREDFVEWALETDPAVIADTSRGADDLRRKPFAETCARVRCPVLVIHGDNDEIQSHARGAALADLTGGSLLTIAGGGHGPQGRDPIRVNEAIEQFVATVHPVARRQTWTRASRRRPRALYLSSPIGLGHARRDVAIAAELRARHPDLQIDWLAQHPVTKLLESSGEHVHPASAWLANESAHVEHEAGEHDLHAFQAIRRMDEILVNNFGVFAEVVSDEPYDLVIGDEAWDVDYFLHENPELKRFAFAWMTDFVGWLPMPDGGAREAALTADYNAEMIEQRARLRRVRDRSIFVGDPDDVVPDAFGEGLPSIREWTEANFDFAGYVTGFDPASLQGTDQLRSRLGVAPDEKLCLVTV